MVLLARLHDVDWSRIRDAYGPAESVPARLTELLSEDPALRAEAIDQLHMGIYHQGSIVEATVYSIPFLLELLAADGVAVKADILFLLTGIARSAQYFLRNPDYWHDAIIESRVTNGEMMVDEAERAFGAERGWHEQALAAVEAATNLYVSLRASDDAQVRLGVAYMMGALAATEHGTTEAKDWLLNYLDDDDDQVRAMATFCLDSVAALLPGVVASLVRQVHDTAHPLSRYAAASVLARHLGAQTAQAAIAILFQVIDDPDRLSALQRNLSDNWTYVHEDWLNMIGFFDAVSRLGPAVAQRFLPTLIRYVGTPGRAYADSLVPILRLVFDRDSLRAVELAELSPGQRALLQAIGDNQSLWAYETGHLNGNMRGAMHTLGLPTERTAFLKRLAPL